LNRASADIWGKKRPRNVACIGEAMVELAFAPPNANTAKISVAGDALNTAVYLRRNWPGQIAFVTAVGADPMSQRLLTFMEAEELDTGFVQRSDQASIGLYAISTDSEGERSFSYWRNQSAARQLFQTDVGPAFSTLEQFDAIYLSAITLAILPAGVRQALIDWLSHYRREKDGFVVFDSNHRPSLWENSEAERTTVNRMWQVTDIGLPTEEDERAIFGDQDRDAILQRLRQAGVSTGALKCGGEGPVSIRRKSGMNKYPAVNEIVDSTAAGDSFNGAYLSVWANGGSQSEAMMNGHIQARKVLGHVGAFS